MMPKSTSKIQDYQTLSTKQVCNQFPMKPHSAIICGQTECGKTVFVLDLIEKVYRDYFEHIVFICPTIRNNKTYLERKWVWSDENVYVVDSDRVQDWLSYLYPLFSATETLYIIDDCASSQDINTKKQMLSKLAFSGRHSQQSIWILTQSYNAVVTDVRRNTKWVALFHCKDRDSFEYCLQENDVIHDRDEVKQVKKQLHDIKHAKLLLFTEQPSCYKIIR